MATWANSIAYKPRQTMKKLSITLGPGERWVIHHLLQEAVSTAHQRIQNLDYTQEDVQLHTAALLQADILQRTNWDLTALKERVYKFHPAALSAIFLAIDNYWPWLTTESQRHVCRNLNAKIYPLISKSFYE